jgi:Iodothyronine deiodinase
VLIEDPITEAERADVARVCMTKMELRPIPAAVDRLDDRVNRAYSAWPDRLFLVGRDGKIVYAGGPGPGGFRPEELERAMKKELAR